MGKSRSRAIDKLRRKLKKIERQLDKSRSRSRSRTRSRARSTRSRARSTRSRSRSRSRSHLRSPSRPLDDPEHSTDDRDTEKPETKHIDAIDLTSETAVPEEVDSEILALLGNFPQEKAYGPDLMPSIVTRWEAILKKGLDKDQRKDILKKYPPPANCKIIDAPKLNPEAQAAAGENVLKRDKAMEIKQNQVSCAITSLGLALNNLCKTDCNKNVIELISDAARLLCDFHHTESVTRKSFILTGLEKSTREGIKDTNIDEWLFGADFAEKLKACKAIKKSGQDLRGTSSQTRNKTQQNNSNLNSKGTTNNHFKPRPQKTPSRPPLKQYSSTNQTKNSQYNTRQTSIHQRNRQNQQHNHRR